MLPPVQYANGKTAPCYRVLEAWSKIFNSSHKERSFRLTYYVIDMEDRDYQVVLGRPWLRAADPDLILSASTWRYRKQTPQIVIEQPRQFAKTMKTNLTMMVMYRPEAIGEAVVGLPRHYQR
jgi:hypothetical protein